MTNPINIGAKTEVKAGVKAIITAGGTSRRFGSNKLLETLPSGKSVIETTVEKFLPYVDEIIIPTNDEVRKSILPNPKIKFAPPGDTRQKSVYNALKACGAYGLFEYVLIHDGARAFIKEGTILKTIEEVKTKNAVVVGVKAIDTIKICDKEGKIIQTPKRDTVYHAQTPQAFRFEDIFEAHKKLEELDFTDDASMMEYLGKDVYIIEGEYSNIKITTKKDLSYEAV